MVLAILAEIAPVRVDHCSGIEVHARHMLLIHWNDDHHLVPGRDLLHEVRRWTIGHLLGQFIPAGILLRAKIWTVEKFLQAQDLRLLAHGLVDQFHVLVDHRLPDLRKRALGAERVTGLNQGAADNAGHGSSKSQLSRKKTIAETRARTARWAAIGSRLHMYTPLTRSGCAE